MSLDFSKLLSKPLDDVKRPPALPAGTYFGQIKKYEFKESRFEMRDANNQPILDEQGKPRPQPIVEFTIQPTHADDSIQELLKDESGNAIDVTKRQQTREMPIDGPNLYVTKLFLEGLGISTAGRLLGEAIPEALHANVMYELTQRAGKGERADQVFNDVRNLRAAD